MHILWCLFLTVWGIMVCVSWVSALHIVFKVRKLTKNNVLLIICTAALISSPFILEGVGEDKYLFTHEGEVVKTIHPHLMWQKDFDKETAGFVVIGRNDIGFCTEQHFYVPVGKNREVKIVFCYQERQGQGFGVNIASELIRRNLPIISDRSIGELIVFHATNQLATIVEKASHIPIEENTNALMVRAELTYLVLHELEPIMSQYNTYPKEVIICNSRH